MKKKILSLVLTACISMPVFSQSFINAPESLLENASDQYASIDLPSNTSVRWRIKNGAIIGDSTNRLVFFNVGSTSPVILTAQLSNGDVQSDTIPIYPFNTRLIDGSYPLAVGTSQAAILQLLRGERFSITTQVSGGQPKPFLRLLDFQGRFLAEGEAIDFRAPVRGSYYVVIQSQTNQGSLLVKGVRNVGGGIGQSSDSTLIQPPASVGRIDKEFYRSATHTGGESLARLGDMIISAMYDFQLSKTLIQAFRNDSLLWTCQSMENDYLRTLSADSQFGILGIGSSGSAGNDGDSVLILQLNPNGTLKKRFSFGTNGYDYGYGASFLKDGSIMATGFTNGAIQGSQNGGLDVFAVRFSPSGEMLRQLQYGTMQDDRVFASRTLPSGNVLLFGDTDGFIASSGSASGQGDIFLTEIDSLCNRIWTSQYGSPENDLAFDLVVEPQSGNAILTGMTTGQWVSGFGNPIKPQVFTMSVSLLTGQALWVRQLGPNEGQSGESIALADSGVGVIFYTNGSFSGANNNSLGSQASDDMVIAFYDFSGNLKWLYQFDQTLERIFARAVAIQGNNIFVLRDHVYVPNAPFATTSVARLTLPKTSAVPSEAKRAQRYQLFQNYPNPFNPTTTIEYQLVAQSEVQLVLYDVLGRQIATLVNERQESGRYRVQLSSGNYQLSSGVYFYRLQAGAFSETRKMVLLK